MSTAGGASVIISNHNYARWLGEAVDSALAQDDVREVIVVDDGSTDDSRELIATYNGGIRAILQDNGGQASALNAGFAASHGDPVLFLDADDVLLDGALREAAAVLEDDSVALVHWTHEMIDERSRPLGARHPAGELPSGDLRPMISELGPGTHRISPTSGNVLPRWALEQLMPMPAEFRICADVYLTHLAPLFGQVVALDRPYSLYRVHPESGYSAASFDRRLELGYETIEQVIEPCAKFCGQLGLRADPVEWRRNSWFHRLHAAVATLDQVVPPGAPFLLIDDGQTAMTATPDRNMIPFPERDGAWWGPPADDAAAVDELERQRSTGAAYLVVLWIADWWLEHYSELGAYLREHCRLVHADELLTVFDLQTAP